LGSGGLHGRLHWILQSSDELPMIYFMLALLYCDAEVDAATGKQNSPWLAPATIATAISNTVVYLYLLAIVLGLSPHIYHCSHCSQCMYWSLYLVPCERFVPQ
jgi:hypothetical protein